MITHNCIIHFQTKALIGLLAQHVETWYGRGGKMYTAYGLSPPAKSYSESGQSESIKAAETKYSQTVKEYDRFFQAWQLSGSFNLHIRTHKKKNALIIKGFLTHSKIILEKPRLIVMAVRRKQMFVKALRSKRNKLL